MSQCLTAAAVAAAGVKYPLRWIQQIKAKSTDAAQWRVLVDAAAYVPTQPLDLREVSPDFVALSFYKMFGYPTVRSCAVQA
jgi:molybdenum cofactor sulfurtransferase